ncbi:MAG: hypothetical protein J6U86_05330 [Clostridia bacterium]|nr:hypothetical protein [Clostridia bacterium]
MNLLYGLNDNALLQRDNDNMCACTFGAECKGELVSSLGLVERIGEDAYTLCGMPAGGPYEVTLSDDEDSVKLTLWVGDIWLLGGQSNMEGSGRFREKDMREDEDPNPAIRAYYSDNRWGAAVHMLHEPWISVDDCQREFWRNNQINSPWKSDQPEFISHGVAKRGIGPGVFFARKLYELTGGVPQALVPCALGGSGMFRWNPDAKEDNLYHAMVRRVKRVGGKVRGLFWYQGCNECYDDGIEKLHYRMARMIDCLRRECKDDKLPVVQVQIAKNNIPTRTLDVGFRWERLREKQRTLGQYVPYLDTVAAIDSSYSDLIHISADSQENVGLRGALSMAALCGFGGALSPKLSSMEMRWDECIPFRAVLVVHFENASNLMSYGAPLGFSITETPEEEIINPTMRIARIAFEGDAALIYTELSQEALAGCYLHYGYANMGHCNIVDKNGHSLLAMGPVCIADYLK